MDETRIRQRLDDLARDAGAPDLSELGRRTIGRARRRRTLNALAAGLVAIGIAAGSYAGVRSILVAPESTIGNPDPSLTPDGGGLPGFEGFPGLWPETDAEALAEMQAQVDAGHHPMRVDPEGTALLLATGLLGWEPTAAQTTFVERGTPDTIVELRNTTFGGEVPPLTVVLGQLGRPGENGVWSVVRLSSPLIEATVGVDDPRATVTISGEVSTVFDGARTLELSLLAGPSPGQTIGHASVGFTSDRMFELELDVPPTPSGHAVLLVSMPDATGASLGATLIPVPTPVGEPEPRIDVAGVPPDVAVTAQRIYDAIPVRDFQSLASLLDPMTFVFNLDDGGDPIPAWRDDPSALDLAIPILELPAAAPREIEGFGTFYIWPYLIDSDFSALTDEERADLRSLGYSERDIELMVQGGNGYQGPRLAIDANGLWRNLITVGE